MVARERPEGAGPLDIGDPTPAAPKRTPRYLGLKTKADPIEVCRAFDI